MALEVADEEDVGVVVSVAEVLHGVALEVVLAVVVSVEAALEGVGVDHKKHLLCCYPFLIMTKICFLSMTLEILNVVYLLIMKWNLSIVAVGTFKVVLADLDLDC